MAAGTSTPIRAARRQQILRGAIDVLAQEGLGRASFTRIARRAGLSSPGLISYHFEDKQDLLLAVAGDVVARFDDAVATAVAASTRGATGQLRAYVRAAVEFQDAHLDDVRALWQVMWGHAATGEGPVIDKGSQLAPVQQLLERGIAAGEFRAVDTGWVARSVHAAVTGFLDVATDDPHLDVEAFIEETQALFVAAMAAPGRRGDP